MILKNIRTHAQLVTFLREKLGKDYLSTVSHSTFDDVVKWFVATQEAKLIIDSYSTRDLANLLLDGYKPIDEQAVTDWISVIYEDIDFITDRDDPDLPAMEDEALEEMEGQLRNHFGNGIQL